MGKITGWTAVILVILALIVGGFLAYGLFPQEKIITKTIIQEVSVPTEVLVEKTIEVPMDASETYLQTAIDDFMNDKLEDMTSCKGDEYDEEQIIISKIYDEWAVLFDEDKHDVEFKVKLKYLDSDVEAKCYDTCEVKVSYEEDEDAQYDVDC